MVAHLTKLSEIIAKMLRSLPPRFKQIIIMIKTLLDVSTISIVDLTGSGRRCSRKRRHRCSRMESCTSPRSGTHKRRSVRWGTGGARGDGVGKGHGHGRGHGCGGSSSGGLSNKLTDNECWCCGKMGHWAHECHSKPKKEQAYVA
jgi:hypothetical protein